MRWFAVTCVCRDDTNSGSCSRGLRGGHILASPAACGVQGARTLRARLRQRASERPLWVGGVGARLLRHPPPSPTTCPRPRPQRERGDVQRRQYVFARRRAAERRRHGGAAADQARARAGRGGGIDQFISNQFIHPPIVLPQLLSLSEVCAICHCRIF
jgi:hypothetical protein